MQDSDGNIRRRMKRMNLSFKESTRSHEKDSVGNICKRQLLAMTFNTSCEHHLATCELLVAALFVFCCDGCLEK